MFEELTCNSYGAPLEVLDSADFVTCNHCSTWPAVRRTDNITFTEQLDRLAKKTEELSERLDNLNYQHDLETIDREWDFEREKYMISGRDGVRSIPETGSSVVGGIIIGVFGCLWAAIAVGITASAPLFRPFKVAKAALPLFVIGGVLKSITNYSNAEEYRRAEQRYRRWRTTLLSGQSSSTDRSE